MLSVLIPIFNFDVRQLVKDLHQQLCEVDLSFEIICFDDGSTLYFKMLNREIASLSNIIYQELPQNLGRARIRNALAERAGYSYLLFLDCDSRVTHRDFIRRYLQHLQPDLLLYGGRSYPTTPPHESDLMLHWYYGTRREQIPDTQRGLRPYHAFMTNNFLIPKSVFEIIKFDGRITKYGHEDTLFGLELQKHHIKILHLNNPLEHIGLESTGEFLNKTHQGIQNLAQLAEQYPDLDTKLLRSYRILKKWRLTNPASFFLQLSQSLILQNLKSSHPKLGLFDLYKLKLLIEAAKKLKN